MVSYCDQTLSVVRALSPFCFKKLHLQNSWMDFKIISQVGFVGDPLPKLLKRFAPLNKMAARGKIFKRFKRYLFLNQWMDFEIIIQECSLDDPVPKLLKPFRSVEQNGHQGYKWKTALNNFFTTLLDRF